MVQEFPTFVHENVLFTRDSSWHRYETNGASTVEVEDGVASKVNGLQEVCAVRCPTKTEYSSKGR